MSASPSAAVHFLPPIATATQSSPRVMREAELLQLLDEHERRRVALEQQQWQTAPKAEEEEKQQTTLHTSAQPSTNPDTVAAMDRTQLSATLPLSDPDAVSTTDLSDILTHLPPLLDSPFASLSSQRAVEWMWLLLHRHSEEAVALLTDTDALTRLTVWLDDALRRCKGRVEKQRRNNLVALLSTLAQRADAQAQLGHCGLAQVALVHATHSEHRSEEHRGGGRRGWGLDECEVEEESKEPLVLTSTSIVGGECRWTQSSDAGDLELRQLLWALLASLSSHWICHALIHQGQLLSALLHYVDAGAAPLFSRSTSPTPAGGAGPHWLHRRWSASQLLELQRSALSALLVIAPTMCEQFAALQGVERLICFVQAMAGGSEMGGVAAATAQGQALQSLAVKTIAAALEAAYATPWHPELDALLLSAQSISAPSTTLFPSPSPPPSTSDPSASSAASPSSSRPSTSSTPTSAAALSRLNTPARLTLQVTLRILLSVVLDPAVPLECRADAMGGLTSLGAEQAEVQRLMRRERCVELLASMLNDDDLVTTLVAHCPAFMAHLVSFVWRCIVGDAKSEELFLQCRGVAGLLDLITRTSTNPLLQHQTLGCLADLLSSASNSHAPLREWTSSIALTSLRPANPQFAALPLSTGPHPSHTSSSASTTSPSTTPQVTALDVLLALWPDEPLSPHSLPLSELVWSALSGVGFGAAAFPDARPSQLAELARIATFPLILQHRQWSAVVQRLQADGLWPHVLPFDVRMVEDAQGLLEERILDARREQRRLMEAQDEVDEAELHRFLHIVDDRRIELSGRILHAAQRQRAAAAAAFDHSFPPHPQSRSPLLSAPPMPGAVPVSRSGVSGHFASVAVTSVQGMADEAGSAAAAALSRPDSGSSGESEEEQKQQRLQGRQLWW